MKRFRTLVLAAILLAFAACSTTSTGGTTTSTFDVCSAVTVVAAQQLAVQTAAGTIITLHNTGTTVSASVYQKAALAYGAWYQAQGVLESSLITINDSGGNVSSVTMQQYLQLGLQVAVLAADFISVYNSISSTKTPAMTKDGSGSLNLQKMQMGAAAACAITDDQIKAQLVPLTWAQLGG